MGRATPDVETLGRRERKKRETSEALQTAALRLFLQRGFDETTIEDITEAADVAKRTFFRYFDSKESVLFAQHEETLEVLGDALDRRPDHEPVLDAIRAALRELAELHSSDRERNLIRARIAFEAPSVRARAATAREDWEQLIARFVARRLGSTPDDLRPALIAGSTMAGLMAALTRWVAGGGLEDPGDLVDDAMALMRAGFGLDA